ncbi:3-deoxy-manno-octulosonate cytidylyltransferase [Neochlamydia sp. AcF65]|uniref:3-deoxy-manno-octulosonate cytidylyltransferase n=1 Tax=Neochlamydia sp. AcF65 TaxID=2795735 RepID=UPI001BC98AE2|nr:3-deoxy-manno-octulosonate cytidylyltransferase [Neochlamydia sp. AcF65]
MSETKSPKIIGVIPARYGSTRFPGKPLASILGKSLIQRTYENTKKCLSLDEVFVATDDNRIFEHVESFGGKVVMTSSSCPTGSDRLIEAVQANPLFKEVAIVVNIQGDEPCLEPSIIHEVVQLLLQDPHNVMSTAVTKIHSEAEALNPFVVKCCLDLQGNALYFSRSLIPSNPSAKFDPRMAYFKHIGIYGFRREFLFTYGKLGTTPLQLAEDLEQLKVLEHGYKIKTAIVESASLSVDHPEDIKKIESLLLCKQNICS